MENSCSFESVIIYNDVAYISTFDLSVAERFATQPINRSLLPFSIADNYTRQISVFRLSRYILALLDVSNCSQFRDMIGCSLEYLTPLDVVQYFFDWLGYRVQCYEFFVPGLGNIRPAYVIDNIR